MYPPTQRTHAPLAILGAVWLSAILHPQAGEPAWTAQNRGTAGPALPFALGYRFAVTQNLPVTHLGRVDYNGGGLAVPALARLYDWGSGAALAEVTIPAGLSGRETNGALVVHYAPLASSVTLRPGAQYLVAVEATEGDFAYDAGVTMADPVQWIEGRATPVGSPAMPATATETSFAIARPDPICYLGASFKFEPPPTPTLTLSFPKTRQIVQRDTSDRADILLEGTWSGPAARLEARAIVMPGGTNNGLSTDWVLVGGSPITGSFAGVLPGVMAGGWYQIEMRALDEQANVVATRNVERVGVGDLLVTAGQSNAACFGSPTQKTDDDRISAYSLSARTWRLAADPQPDNSGGTGTGGSPWPRLGSLLVQSNRVPVGFIGLAYGGTSLAQWAPGTALYRNLTNTLVRFGPNGVRAVLWHQGESDALESTSAVTYAQRLSNIVTRARAAAGWSVPWGIAEASFHPSASRAQEEAVAAGQRWFTATTPDCFRGPRTDDFNLEGKLSDSVHFNQAGLTEHARRWADALCGVENLTPKNGNFEANAARNDGVTTTTSRIIGWNRLNGAGTGIAAGANGYFNPDSRTYPNSADTLDGGVLPHMDGRHIATLGSSATNGAFLQTLNARLQPSTIYTFTVALGVRTNDTVFGGYRLDWLANGMPLSPGTTGDLASLNALAGGNATGAFTVVSCVHTSAVAVVANQPLALRITKPGGAGTYLDFDHVQVSSRLTPYGEWQVSHWESLTDPASLPETDQDADGLPNLIESQLAEMDPRVPDALPLPTVIRREGEDYLQARFLKNPASTFGTLGLEVSFDLTAWFDPATLPPGDVIFLESPDALTVQFRRRTIPSAFIRLWAKL